MAPMMYVRRLLSLTALVIGVGAGLLAGAADLRAQKPSEYRVKAAYLYGFGRFVDWPTSAPAAGGNAFVVCVLGDDPFGRLLDDVASDAVMKDKPVAIRRIARVEESGSCHTVFIGASEEARLGRILDSLGERPVLTVSDAPGFAQRGGMIGFFLDDNRVRFTVNLAATQDAGLRMNSELLRVAANILKSRPPGD
jgi:hypothetical protein